MKNKYKLKMRTITGMFLLLFFGAVNSGYAQYCTADGGFCDEAINAFSFNTISSASGCSGGYADNTAMSTNVTAGLSYPVSITTTLYYGGDQAYVWIDYNMDNVFDDPGERTTLTYSGSGGVFNGTVNIPPGATPGLTRLRARLMYSTYYGPCGTANYGEVEDYSINVIGAVACSGTPAAGTTTGPAGVCSGASFTVGLSGSSTASGITYQWQSSPDGVTYTNIPGATGPTASLTQTASTYYQCVVTCTGSGLSANSTALFIPMNSVFTCYCVPTYSSGCSFGDEITNVTLLTLNNSSSCTTGSFYTFYSSATVPNLAQGSSNTITISFGADANQYAGVWIDFNQDGDFADAGEFCANNTVTPGSGGTTTLTINVPAGAALGQTMMRVRGGNDSPLGNTPCATSSSSYGETEDYKVNIFALPACSGTPTAGATTGPSGVCSGAGFMLALSGSSSSSGLTYQWQSSPDGVTYTNIAGAVNPTLTLSETASTYYQCIVTCTASGLSATSMALFVPLNAPYLCTCSSMPTTTFDEEITNVTVGTLNNSSTCTTVAPGPGSVASRYGNYTSGAGAPSAPSIPATVSPSFSVTVGTCGSFNYTSGLAIFIDLNQDGDFADAGEKVYTNGASANINCLPATVVSATFTIPGTATLGTTVMRIINAEGYAGDMITPCLSYGYGETEDYLITIAPAPPCPSPTGLAAGSITTTSASLSWSCTSCTGTFSLEYGPTGFTPGTGTLVSPAVSPVAVTGLTPGTAYQFYVTQDCSGTGDGLSFPTGPIPFSTQSLGDDVCSALPIAFGTNGPFSNSGMTTQTGEPAPPATGCGIQTGWCESSLSNTMWFSFTAPASGRVKVQSPGFDTQLALWDAPTGCASILSGGATLIAANDDDPDAAADGGVSFSSMLNPVSCLVPGRTYFVQLDGYFGTTGSTTIVLTDLGVADPSFTGLTGPACASGSALALSPVMAGGVFAGTGVSGSSFDPAAAGAGTYSVTYTVEGCYTSTQSITVNAAPSVTASSTAIACNGQTSTVTVSATGGTPSYMGTGSYLQSAGTTLYTVTDANSCSGTTSVTVTEPPVLVVSTSSTPIMCNGGFSTITISATGGTPSYSGTGSYSEPAGTLSYTVMDANGCSATASTTITEPPALVPASSSTAIACNGGTSTVTITASGGTPSYSGTGSFPQTAGTTTYTVTDANSCVSTLSVTVTQPAVLNAALSSTGIGCYGDSATVTVSATGGTPSYSGTGAFTQAPGTVTYTVTDANGCLATVNNTETEPSEMFIGSGATSVMCNGGSSTVTISAIGGTPAYTGTGNFTQFAGTSTYTVMDANGCSVTTTVTVTEPPLLTSAATSTSIMCNGDSSAVTVSASGGTAAYSGTGTFMQAAGTTVYTVTDANGCTSTSSVTVTEPAAITSSQTADLCPGQSVTVGSNTYTTAGTYTDVLTATSSCDSTVTTVVTTITVDISTSVSGATITAGSSTASYQWLDCNAGMALIPGETNQSYTTTGSGDFAVVVTENGCVDTSACVNITATGIAAANENDMIVYPNPASGIFNLGFANANFSELLITIVDIQGKLVYSASEKNVNGAYTKVINLGELSKGLYYIKVNTGMEVKIKKLTIQ
jgi:hypothetical protein